MVEVAFTGPRNPASLDFYLMFISAVCLQQQLKSRDLSSRSE